MKHERRCSRHLVNQGEDNQCHRAVATAGDKCFLAFYLEKAEKCVFRQDASDTFDSLLGVHIVGNYNGIIEYESVRECVGIQQGSEYKNKQALEPHITDKIRYPEC